MLVDLVSITTRDGVRLDAAYQPPEASRLAADVFLCVHGTGGNFYASTLFDAVGHHLRSLGAGVLRVNTRGHDLMSTAATPRGGQRFGAAYETLDDCRHDLAGWLDWLAAQGVNRVGLIGHSSGAVKCLYSQAHEAFPAVEYLLALSPPRLSHAWFAQSDRAAEFRHTFAQAEALVTAGEPGHLLDVRVPLPFVTTAAGYVEKYGPDERYNYLRVLDRVRCPVLVTFGERELIDNMAFRGSPEAIRAATPDVRVETVARGDHFYTGVRDGLVACLDAWLRNPGLT